MKATPTATQQAGTYFLHQRNGQAQPPGAPERNAFMIQIFLNSLVAVLIASAFLTTAITALSSQDRSLRKVPVKVRTERQPNADRRS